MRSSLRRTDAQGLSRSPSVAEKHLVELRHPRVDYLLESPG